MSKIFEFKPGSYIDQVTGEVMTNTDGEFVRSEKGLAWKGNGTSSKIVITETAYAVNSSEYSFEFWARREDASRTNDCILGSSVTGGSRYIAFIGGTTLSIESDTNGNARNAILPKDDTLWHHYIITCNAGVVVPYQDGVALSVTGTDLSNTITFDQIGAAGASEGTAYIGRIQIYDHILTSQERAKLYNEFLQASPTTKAIEQNTVLPKATDLSHEVDSVIGVKDADAVTELVTNGGFDTDTDWSKTSEWTISNGVASYDDTGTGILRSLSPTFTIGKKYKLEYTISNASGNASIYFLTNNGSNSLFTEWLTYKSKPNGTYSEIVTCKQDSYNELTIAANTTGSEFALDNVSIKEWDGEELIPDDDVGFVANDVSKWVPYGSNISEQDGNAVKNTRVDSGSGSLIRFRISDNTMFKEAVVGQKYRFAFKAKVNTGSVILQIWNDISFTQQVVSNTEYQVFYVDIEAGAPNALYMNMSDFDVGEIVWVEFVSIKKVTGLIAAYNMIPNGSTLVDISGEGLNHTILGGISTDKGMQFNFSSNGRGTSCTSTSYGQTYTIAFRASFDVIDSGNLARAQNYIMTYSTGEFLHRAGNGTNASFAVDIRNTGLRNIVLSRISGLVTLYVDGVKISTEVITNDFSWDGFVNNSTYPFKGVVEDFSIYNRAWTEQEAIDYHNKWQKQEFKNQISDLGVGDSIG